MSYQVWEGELYLYTVHSEDEANEAEEAGFTVVAEVPQEVYFGA